MWGMVIGSHADRPDHRPLPSCTRGRARENGLDAKRMDVKRQRYSADAARQQEVGPLVRLRSRGVGVGLAGTRDGGMTARPMVADFQA